MALPGDAVAASAPAAPRRRGSSAPARERGRGRVARRFGARARRPRRHRRLRGRALAGPRLRARARRACSSTRSPTRWPQPLQRAVAQDPLSVPPDDWRDWVVDPALPPPPVDANSPLIALVDAQLDRTHPEWQGGNTDTIDAVRGHQLARHGDHLGGGRARQRRSASSASGRARARSTCRCRSEITCARSADQIARGDRAPRRGHQHELRSERGSASRSTWRSRWRSPAGSCPSPPPATSSPRATRSSSPPRCRTSLTVAAVGPPPDFRSSFFSNANAAIDLSAPGENDHDRRPARRSTPTAQDGYVQPERHELRRPDGGRPRSPGCAPRART